MKNNLLKKKPQYYEVHSAKEAYEMQYYFQLEVKDESSVMTETVKHAEEYDSVEDLLERFYNSFRNYKLSSAIYRIIDTSKYDARITINETSSSRIAEVRFTKRRLLKRIRDGLEECYLKLFKKS